MEAIGQQRWFGFRDRSRILFDKTTGLLWGDVSEDELEKYQAIQFVKDFDGGGYSGWRIPFVNEFEYIVTNSRLRCRVNRIVFAKMLTVQLFRSMSDLRMLLTGLIVATCSRAMMF